MLRIILFFFIFSILNATAQDASYTSYQWEKSRKLFQIDDQYSKEPVVILYLGITVESKYKSANNNELNTFETVHKIVKINSSEEVDNNNKVYIYLKQDEEIIDIKARAYGKAGAVTELNKNNIKEIKSEEDVDYKIFAIEGAEPGGEIEFLYKVKRNFSRNSYYTFQQNVPVKQIDFALVSPENLVNEIKIYNGIMIQTDTVIDKKRIITTNASDLPALTEEPFSNAKANQLRLEYQLAYNTSTGNSRLFSWHEAAQTIYNMMFVVSPKEQKAASSLYKSLRINEKDSDQKKIIAIDNFIRKNFHITDQSPFVSINDIVQKKVTTEEGAMRLYGALFRLAEIDYQLVYSTNRFSRKFDPEFDSWSYLEISLFYFPASDKYLAPLDFSVPFGPAPHYLTNNNALFVKRVTIGDFESAVAELKFIQPLPSSFSKDDMEVVIEFEDEMQLNKLKILRSMSGYNAFANFAAYSFLDTQKKDEVVKEVIQYMIQDGKFENITLKNSIDYPLIDTVYLIEAMVSTNEFLENAGNKFLFRIGNVIGPQSELYAEENRKQEIENSFNRQYNRKLSFTLPEGYVVKNLSDLKMNVYCKNDDQRIFVFESDYKVEGRKVVVNIHEAYDQINYPAAKYEDFRKVINAAADFNKIALIIEPE